MKLGTKDYMDLIFSDIHADIKSLETILDVVHQDRFREKYGKFSKIINLGDILERGTHPKEVIKKLKILSETHPIESVIGNHDEAFLYGRQVSGSSLESIDVHLSLDEKDIEFFKINKDGTYGKQEYVDKKNRLLCVHGGPLNPDKITPKDAGEKAWLYQKSWQRISEENFEFFSYAGYHYKPSSAFSEVGKRLDNFLILCGHQHEEAAIVQTRTGIDEILTKTVSQKEKIANFTLEKKEFIINQSANYLIRIGISGPEGYNKNGITTPQFGIIEYDPKKVTLFTIKFV
jgi:predicted phosphodiesterase